MTIQTPALGGEERDREPRRLRFGAVSIDLETRLVRTPGGGGVLEPRAFDVLLTLLERPGLTASHEHLIETVWRGIDGSSRALGQAVAGLRGALGDDARAPRFIETVTGLGYRWIYEEPPLSPVSRSPFWSAWIARNGRLATMIGGLGGDVEAWGRGARRR
ncbi:winged helix-turn-helix domain-containing protein [uncultured Caulobacter sp.]|uniref:winged helix-turn-helix domain-containing protein n=1 Tax=uncultured Caulobacter sp. TaxID=158749 RepID=UPI00260F3564|nr:winged helix-turn-helix domain-containing protein [uncultured Caulobacter sp.]